MAETSHHEDSMNLLDAALMARENAYAPYSKFRVGAAVKGESGRVFAGCNVENVAYPEGTCAEAGAIAALIAAGDTQILEILVMADGPNVISPCGGCRQKIAEFATGNATLFLARPSGVVTKMPVGDLLPGAFEKSHLSSKKT